MNETNYFSILKNSLKVLFNRTDLLTVDRIKYELKLFEGNITPTDVLAVIFWLIIILESRTACCKLLMPICLSAGCEVNRIEKICECFWKGLFHTVVTCLSAYILFKPTCLICFNDVIPGYLDYSPKTSIPFDIKLLFYLLFSYYCFGLYTIVFTDVRKKDTELLIFHHIITLSMLALAFYSRCIQTLPVISFLHDINDIFLELGRLCFHYSFQKGGVNPVFTKLANFWARLLLISWFITRIYYYPMKFLIGILVIPLNLFIWLVSIGAWFVMAMDVFWFLWIFSNHLDLMRGRVTHLSDLTSIEKEKNKVN